MLSAITRLCAPKVSAFLLVASGLAFAAPASAGRSNPAPIQFKGSTSPSASQSKSIVPGYTQVTSGQPIRTPRNVSSADRKSARIEFRYPDQPGTVYDRAGGSYRASNDPIVFSSAKAAISPTEARQYASIEAPQMSVPQVAHDPAITKGGFDARATAQETALQRASKGVYDTPLAPVIAAPSAVNLSQQNLSASSLAAVSASPATLDKSTIAVVYGDEFVGYPTANGEIFTHDAMTAAHPDMPLPSLVHVTNPANGQEVVVRVNDRGPFEDNAGLQVSKIAAQKLGIASSGQSQISMRYLGPAPVMDTAVTTPAINPVAASYELANIYNDPAYTPVVESAPKPYTSNTQMSPSTSEQYFVQVGSFSDIGNAQSLSNSISSDMSVEISPVRVNGADYFRVQVGPVSTRQAANNLRSELDIRGIQGGQVISK